MADVPVGCFPVGRRRFQRQRRADEPARRSPAADVLDRLRGLRPGGELPRSAVRAAGRQAFRLRSPRAQRHRRRVPRLPARARLPAGRADRRSGLPADALPLPAGAARRRHRRAGRRGERRGVRRLRRHGPHPQRRVATLGTHPAAAALRPRRAARGQPPARASPPGGPTCCAARATVTRSTGGSTSCSGTTRSRTC